MKDFDFDYTKLSEKELRDVLYNIDTLKYPERAKTIETELQKRKTSLENIIYQEITKIPKKPFYKEPAIIVLFIIFSIILAPWILSYMYDPEETIRYLQLKLVYILSILD